jgi:SAM-dependent methyltransferase
LTPHGVIPSPNVWNAPDTYELENLAVDRAGIIEAAMRDVQDWSALDVVDVGCGTGFHLPRFAETARSVTGVEPHLPLATRALARVGRLSNVQVITASAATTTLPSASIDMAHARWPTSSGRAASRGWPSWTA